MGSMEDHCGQGSPSVPNERAILCQQCDLSLVCCTVYDLWLAVNEALRRCDACTAFCSLSPPEGGKWGHLAVVHSKTAQPGVAHRVMVSDSQVAFVRAAGYGIHKLLSLSESCIAPVETTPYALYTLYTASRAYAHTQDKDRGPRLVSGRSGVQLCGSQLLFIRIQRLPWSSNRLQARAGRFSAASAQKAVSAHQIQWGLLRLEGGD